MKMLGMVVGGFLAFVASLYLLCITITVIVLGVFS